MVAQTRTTIRIDGIDWEQVERPFRGLEAVTDFGTYHTFAANHQLIGKAWLVEFYRVGLKDGDDSESLGAADSQYEAMSCCYEHHTKAQRVDA